MLRAAPIARTILRLSTRDRGARLPRTALAASLLAGLTGTALAVGCGGSSTASSAAATTTAASSTTGTGGAATTGTGGAATTGTGGAVTTGTGGAATTGTGGAATTGTGGAATTGTGGAPPTCVVDGVVTPPEQCDDNNAIDGDGCDNDCTFSCVDPIADCPAPPACQQSACLASHLCGTAPDPAQDGSACGASSLCKAGVCAPIVCGDGLVEGTEQCDFGAANGPGTGCEVNCTLSCSKLPDSCPDASTCNGVEACTTVFNGQNVGQKCQAGVQLLDCSACAGGLCASGVCKASTCGDGCVDPAKGEQCEPPGTALCDAACKTIVVNPCGNGVRDAGEQCDDGNTQNLDGCDATCHFEQVLRSNYLQMQFGVDPFCGNVNQLGSAIAAGLPQGQIQTGIDQGITAGTSGFVAKLLNLGSLSGADDPMLQLGVVRGLPTMGAAYNGANDLDWWYSINPATIDASRTPLDQLSGSILGNVLNVGPGTMTLPVDFFPGALTLLRLTSAKLQIIIGPSFAPTVAAGNAPPGHVAAEHLDPALTSFGTLGQANANLSGKLCGNVTAASLAQTPAPVQLLPGGVFACFEGYSAASSLLDVFVSGCTINGGGFAVQVIFPTQPDTSDPGAPVGGAGAPYHLGVNAQKIVTSCTDKTNAAAPLATCLPAAAYSSFFRIAMDRVIAK